MTRDELNRLSSAIIKASIDVHKTLGPGLLESVYQRCLVLELEAQGLNVAHEVPLRIEYRGRDVSDDAFRMDLVVEDQVVVELKSVEEVKPVHEKQLMTYLKLANKPLGLLINFNEVLLKDGITRVINGIL